MSRTISLLRKTMYCMLQKPDDPVCQVEFNFTGPFLYDPNSIQGVGSGWRALDYHYEFDEDLKSNKMFTPAPTMHALGVSGRGG
jgi:hypothetical protein